MSKRRLAGWVLSGLLAVFLIGVSAVGKFSDWEGKAAMFDQLGWSIERMFVIGVVEVLVTLLFLVPPTGFLGAILLTGYLGGAVATHARVGDPGWLMPAVIGVLVWVALGLRNPAIFWLARGGRAASPAPGTDGTPG